MGRRASVSASLDSNPRPTFADFGELGTQFIQAAVVKDQQIGTLLKFAAKGQNLGVSLLRRGLQADHHVAHGLRVVVAALHRQQEKLAKEIARPPIVLKELKKKRTPADIVRDDGAAAGNLLAVSEADRDQQSLGWHCRTLVHFCNDLVAGQAVRIQIAWRGDKCAIEIVFIFHNENQA